MSLVETLHGVEVADPFRPLENAADPAVVQWVEAENALTRRCLDGALRERLVERLRRLHRHPRSSVPSVRGRRLFCTHNDGTANQAALLVREEAGGSSDQAGATVRTLVDPNVLDPDGTTAITAFEPDDEGRRVVYALSGRGSDVQELHVVDVETARDLPDVVLWVKFASIAWFGDGFFYTRFPAPGSVPQEHEQYFCQVWFHRLGQPQSADRLIHQRADAPTIVFDVDVSSDGAHLVITSRPGASDKAEVHVIDLAGGDPFDLPAPQPVVTGGTDAWHFVDAAGGRLFFRTDWEAPRGRIVRVDLDDPALRPRVVVPEPADTVVDAAIAGGRLLVHSLHHASSRLVIADLEGAAPWQVPLPGIGTIVGIGARWADERAYVTFTSFTMPPQILALSPAQQPPGHPSLTPVFPAPSVVDSTAYVTEQVWYPSRDGTPISMFLVRKRGRESYSAPVLLTGYGGFNISLTPAFDPSDFLWLDEGGIVAVAHLRGGGEYGEAWHQAGMRDRKQRVFDDFIAAAEWLRAGEGAASRPIAIEGGSNGGLLVAAAMVQRPDLFGAVICRVPVADMLRYHLFTVGRFWIPEYGSADDADECAYLRRYSPYHNVVDGTAYPPTLVMTADTDDRVDPGMAKKFAARLQEAVTGTAGGPILLRVEMRAGHGAGKPIAKQIEEQADLHAFLKSHVTG